MLGSVSYLCQDGPKIIKSLDNKAGSQILNYPDTASFAGQRLAIP